VGTKQTTLQELAQAEERMRSVVNHVVDGIISIDGRGIITMFNPAAERIFGYAASEVIGENVRVLMPEPYRGEHDAYIDNYLRTGEAKIIGVGREVVGLRKDGTYFPMELAISEFHLEGRVHFTGIVRDITERKHAEEALRQAEEQMRAVFENVIDGIITIDGRGEVIAFNPAAERLFGYDRAEVVGRNIRMLMPEPYRSEHDGYLANYERTGIAKVIGQGREVTGLRKDGSTFPMDVAVSEFHIGTRRFYTGIVRDVTERHLREQRQLVRLNRQLEHRVAERTRELEAAVRELEAFSYSVSHDLRTPLRGIAGFSRLLLESEAERLSATGRQYLDRVVQGTIRMGRLIDELLNLSRIGRRPLQPEPLDLSALAHAAVAALREAEPERQVEVVIEPGMVAEGDPELVRVVLDNLIGNAWKFTRQTPQARIVVGSEPAQPPTFYVRDNGAGFDMAYADKLFGAFQRLHSDRAFEGSGIGLATVRRIIALHGGEIRGEGAVGRGAVFRFTLPRPRGHDA